VTVSERERLESLHEGWRKNTRTPSEWAEYWQLRRADEEARRQRLGVPFLRGIDNPWHEPRDD
jgi:hypothetical protein